MKTSSSLTVHTSKWSQCVDMVAVLAVIFGVAGTLANSLTLVQTGVEQTLQTDLPTTLFQVSLFMVIAFLFTASSRLGIQKGIAHLSQLNLLLLGASYRP